MRTRLVRVLGLSLVLSLVLVAPASAYIDPGSTTVVFQAVIAGLAAAGMGIKLFWSRIVGFFQRSPKGAEDEGASQAESVPAEH